MCVVLVPIPVPEEALPPIGTARVQEVIVARLERAGDGTVRDPVRVLTQIFLPSGYLVAELDPHAPAAAQAANEALAKAIQDKEAGRVLLREWLNTPYFSSKAEWQKWSSGFAAKVNAHLGGR